MHTRSIAAVASALSLAAALTGCTTKDQVTEPPTAQGGASAAATTAGRFTLTGPGRHLTGDEVRKTLLTEEDLTKNGWDGMKQRTEPEQRNSAAAYDDASPEKCKTWLVDFYTSEDFPGRTAHEKLVWEKGKPGMGNLLTISSQVDTFETPEKAEQELKRQDRGQQDCSSFQMQSKGERTDGKITSLDGLHLAIDFEGDNGIRTSYASDTVVVQFGHNLVTVSIWHHKDIGPNDLRKLIDANLARLDQVTR